MTQDANDIKLGWFLSLVPQHKPSTADITLDTHGWADVGELLSSVQRTGRQIDMDTLERIVRENNKRCYLFNKGHTKNPANQRHSIPVDIKLNEEKPPRRRYLGVAERFLPSIRREGDLEKKAAVRPSLR